MLKHEASTELPREMAGKFKEYLRDMHIWHEASECGTLIHFEVRVTDEEFCKANQFIDTL